MSVKDDILDGANTTVILYRKRILVLEAELAKARDHIVRIHKMVAAAMKEEKK